VAEVADEIWRLRGRADVLRAIADGFRSDGSRAALLRLAEDYDVLANHMAQLTPRPGAAAARRR
jgi:hypothetical protein